MKLSKFWFPVPVLRYVVTKDGRLVVRAGIRKVFFNISAVTPVKILMSDKVKRMMHEN